MKKGLFREEAQSSSGVGGSWMDGTSVPAPVWDMLLGGTVLAGAGSALYYLYQMLFKEKKLFTYCLVGAAINLAMVPPAWKEMRGSLGSVRQSGPESVSPAG